MKVSWGWCPYHGTRKDLDMNRDKSNNNYEQEFQDEYSYRTIEFMQSKNLLVHWTKFIV